jgi:hypothetical protein
LRIAMHFGAAYIRNANIIRRNDGKTARVARQRGAVSWKGGALRRWLHRSDRSSNHLFPCLPRIA